MANQRYRRAPHCRIGHQLQALQSRPIGCAGVFDCGIVEDGGRRCSGLSAARQNGPFDRFPNSGLSGLQIDEVVAAYCEEAAIDQRQYGNARSLRRSAPQPGDRVRIAQRQGPRGSPFSFLDHELQCDYHDQCDADIEH
jgi:hypothetical protein